MISRRQFLKLSAASSAAALLRSYGPWRHAYALAADQIPLPGSAIPQFVDPLPLLSVAGGPIQTIVGPAAVRLHMQEFQAKVLPTGTFAPGEAPLTFVWGYVDWQGQPPDPNAIRDTYTGPVIVAVRGYPIEMTFVNNLPTAAHHASIPFFYPATDQSLHWADPLGDGEMDAMSGMEGDLEHYAGPVPVVPHLHGGEIPPVLDGGPDGWFTSDGLHFGPAYYTRFAGGLGNECVYRYPNTQEAANTWFHDHALGITRLNVYAGLAGAYPIIDPALALPAGLHPVGLARGDTVDYVTPLVIQDRRFDTNGQLFFPATGLNAEHPYWLPEFEGDTILVNGKVWPYLEVEPRRYRFLFVNGSNARTYEMFLTDNKTKVDGPALWQIGTDGGYLDAPVRIDPNAPKGSLQRLTLMPGERADVIIDFAGVAPGARLVLKNVAKTPFPNGATVEGATLGRIMQFRVVAGAGADTSYDPASGLALRPSQPLVRLVAPGAPALALGVAADQTRQLTLNEVMGMPMDAWEGGPLEVLVNNTKWAAAVSEGPAEGDTEMWKLVNLTADAHPIHTHLTQFQLLSRQAFDVRKYDAAYGAAFPGGAYLPAFGPPLDYTTGNPLALGGNPDVTPYLQGRARPAMANEAGWKDTVIVYPGEVTTLVVRYAPTDTPAGERGAYPFDPAACDEGFVWHCHIIDHEDNEMMRPLKVTPAAGATRTFVQGADY